MFYLTLFLIELFILFFLSRILSRRISSYIYSRTRSIKFTVWVLAILFLPGTFLHELAHLILAIALFVKTKSLSLIPKLEEEGKLKMGSVQIEQTDIIRSLLIGIAPLFLGISIIFLSLDFISNIFLKSYIVFEASNTMFSSSKDMEGGLKVLLFLIVIFGILYLVGVHLNINLSFNSNEVVFLTQADKFLGLPIILDLIFCFVLGLLV